MPAYVKMNVTFATADAATLFTVPAGMRIAVLKAGWDVSVAFTGGAASTIGVSSANAAYNTKGDLQGGAAGDAAAALTAGFRGGTVGAKLASNGLVVLGGGDVLRFDRITSAFTAGAANLNIQLTQFPAV